MLKIDTKNIFFPRYNKSVENIQDTTLEEKNHNIVHGDGKNILIKL